MNRCWKMTGAAGALAGLTVLRAAADVSTNGPAATASAKPDDVTQNWNWHVQNTVIVQGDPAFPAKYSGPNSLNANGEVQESVSLDLLAGIRLWRGAEAYVDGLMWQGFGLSKTVGIEAFPNGEAFREGTSIPNVVISRAFLRQTFGLGGETERVEDDQLQLAGERDVRRVTVTVGKVSVKDIFDNNAYANDPRTQFMDWALMANEAWDYPADSLGFTTGLAVELNEPRWALRYGFFQVPRVSNGVAQDMNYLKAWGMVTEFERRYEWRGHPGAARLLVYLNQAHMGSYEAAVESPTRPADITATREYRLKGGVGLNVEQELTNDVGVFSRLGWSDGHNEAWVFSDVDRTATWGISVKGETWGRAEDIYGLAGVVNAISHVHQEFLGQGGLSASWPATAR